MRLLKRADDSATSATDLFPPAWCASTYRSVHSDLRHMDDETLARHYADHGKAEGRQASPVRNRFDFIKLLDRLRPALEIGAFDSPLLHQKGVKHFDVLDQAGLQRRARALNRPDGNVPHIDYVSSTGDLSVVGEKFRLVVSSHAIEHTPDLVAHLAAVERILCDDGVYALMIPDCRYCFDHFIAPKTIADILQAHAEQRKVHSLASIIEHRALTTHNEPARHWKRDHGHPIGTEVDRVTASIREWENSNGSYVDVHAWQFTPDSFMQNVTLLRNLGMTLLTPIRVYQTTYGSNEFLAVLSRQAVPAAPSF